MLKSAAMRVGVIVKADLHRMEKDDQSRVDEILDAYKKAFAGFSEEELMVLDGIIMQPAVPLKTRPDKTR